MSGIGNMFLQDMWFIVGIMNQWEVYKGLGKRTLNDAVGTLASYVDLQLLFR